jgi:dTDP-4-amino-4,6-dideoxygalactose transaminase
MTNDSDLYQKLLTLRTHGITRDAARLTKNDGPWYHEQHDLGFNYRITDIQCALGLSQMRRISNFIERRRELVRQYQVLMAELRDEVELLTEIPGRRSSYHLLIAQVRGGLDRRREVFESLHTQGIRAQVHYIPVHLQPWYRQHYGYNRGDFPQAEAYYDGCLSLPLFPAMSDSDVLRVTDALRRALRSS